MYAQTFTIAGYTPAMSPEQAGKAENQIAVQDGQNFFWNLRGVQSGFGIAERRIGASPGMRHPCIAWVENRKVFLMSDGVYQLSGPAMVRVFAFAANVTHASFDLDAYKWTYAYVGTRHWFCHPRVHGLVYYDQFEDTWGIFRDTCWVGPNFAVTQADNRLVVLLADTVVWSKFDEGHTFLCDWYCGSGAQSLALIRYGQPYTVMPYQNGWLTFTSMGLMTSAPEYGQVLDPDGKRVMAGPLIYRHEESAFDSLPLGPACIEHIEEREVLWLSQDGFWSFKPTQGGGFGAPQPYAQLMGRFYAETLVPQASANGMLLDNFALHYARDMRWLFVSSRTGISFPYTRAHVYQIELDKWGSYDFEHLFIGYGRRDAERAQQQAYERHFGIIDENAEWVRHDPNNGTAASWVKFTPMRLQIPNEDMLVHTMTSVQGLRVGVGPPNFTANPSGRLRSSWVVDAVDVQKPSVFDMFVASGLDANTEWPDEGNYARETDRTHEVIAYACHSTGVVHSLIAIALNTNQHFDIRHIEMSYFFAGVK